MHIPRLTALAELLDVTAPDKFNLRTWHCGSTACAVGTACLHPGFQAQGLYLDVYDEDLGTLVPHLGFGDGTTPLVGWAAVNWFFDLTSQQSHSLFSEISYDPGAAPADVAARIRGLIRGGQA